MKQWFKGRNGALFFLLAGIGLMVVYLVLEFSFPRADQLETATGRVQSRRETRDALYWAMAIDGGPRQFVLYAKGDADGRLRAALRAADWYPVSVRFSRPPDKPGNGGGGGGGSRSVSSSNGGDQGPGEFYTVYGVAVGGKDVSGLEVVRGDYRRDNLVALWMGVVLAGCGALRLRLVPRIS